MKQTELRKLQLNLLETLKFIDNFCKKHKIRYYLIYGSLIGAARHKGFIPWDDDLDIAMTKKDYDKFCELFSKEDTGKYFLQTKETDKEYYLDFAKVRDTSTTFIETNAKDKNMVFGTYVDIFPMIGVPKNKILKQVQKINRAIYLSTESRIINNNFLQAIIMLVIKFFGKKRIKKLSYKNMMKYKSENTPYLFSCFAGLYEGNIHPKEYFGQPKFIKFEDIKVPVPREYDKVLRKTYGDYMQIPTDIQKNNWKHSIEILDLEKPYTYYINKKK